MSVVLPAVIDRRYRIGFISFLQNETVPLPPYDSHFVRARGMNGFRVVPKVDIR